MCQDVQEGDADAVTIGNNWRGTLFRWAHLLLPNGQIARSTWQEVTNNNSRIARMVKVKVSSTQYPEDDKIEEFAEVIFYAVIDFQRREDGPFEEHCIAVASFLGQPDEDLLKKSSGKYWSMQHQKTADVRAFLVTDIQSCAMLGPDMQYRIHRDDESADDRWFYLGKPGLKLASMTEYRDAGLDDEDN
ncbi:hypothetical protein C8F01DRAFT_1094910 [Mycena amicta]|nr:hypothetical protein C8F01DRAFT_1094910 [Mycena amicta]